MFLILYVFTLDFFMPVATHGHDASFNINPWEIDLELDAVV
jgi:hypothetical protein